MSYGTRKILLLAVCLLVAFAARAELVVTEVMNSSGHQDGLAMDWWELTNAGQAAVNLLGYSWDDESELRGVNRFGELTIAAGESIILLDDDGGGRIEAWKGAWGLGAQMQVYGYGSG